MFLEDNTKVNRGNSAKLQNEKTDRLNERSKVQSFALSCKGILFSEVTGTIWYKAKRRVCGTDQKKVIDAWILFSELCAMNFNYNQTLLNQSGIKVS